MNKRKWPVGPCLICITLLYIWSNSLVSVNESNRQSESVLKVIEAVFHTAPLDKGEAEHVVRKAAHVAEYALLGLEISLFLLLGRRAHRQNLINLLFFGTGAAIVDETIQSFTGRGSQVTDVILDFLGVAIGAAAGLAAHALYYQLKKGELRKRRSGPVRFPKEMQYGKMEGVRHK